MQRAFVLSKTKKPLMPCHPARARELLKKKKAKVYRLKPFTIILTEREDGETQEVELKVDPGSKTSGMALVATCKRGKKVIFAANLEHRGHTIKKSLDSRRAVRRARRFRKTRYRAPRFLNRVRPKGWLPPSLQSRVDNLENWAKKLLFLAPIAKIAVETVRFDMQKIVHPEISGTEYQHGELFGYELREYILEKFKRTCVYCDAQNVPLEVEHIVPKSKGGSNRVSNLTLSCVKCNQEKGNQPVEAFVKDSKRLAKIKAQAKAPLRDAAAVNATRYATGNALKKIGLVTEFFSGGRTKFNRLSQGYHKDHWIDAACVGFTGRKVYIPKTLKALQIKAEGRGSRQKCRVNKYGFPRTSAKSTKRVYGFCTGDFVRAVVPKGKKQGSYSGRVAVRTTGNFNLTQLKKTIQGINHRYCRLVQRSDGYSYS